MLQPDEADLTGGGGNGSSVLSNEAKRNFLEIAGIKVDNSAGLWEPIEEDGEGEQCRSVNPH